MLLKHCEYCREMFVPKTPGLTLVFCRECVKACEIAMFKIRRYLPENLEANSAQISADLNIPFLYVHHLFKVGRIAPHIVALETRDKPFRPCTVCRKNLADDETVYCGECNVVIEKRMHTRYSLSSGVKEDITTNSTTSSNLKNMEKGRSKSFFKGAGRITD